MFGVEMQGFPVKLRSGLVGRSDIIKIDSCQCVKYTVGQPAMYNNLYFCNIMDFHGYMYLLC